MASDNFSEMVGVLEDVAKVNRAVTRPVIEKKTGLQIVNAGADHGQIVTKADEAVSLYLLDGGLEGVSGLRERYPGSFSEEDDSSQRTTATEIYQVDPIDGTGDFSDTYQTDNVIGPTTLVSKLERPHSDEKFMRQFSSKAGMIFDVLHEIALVSDGEQVGLFKIDEQGSVREVPYETRSPEIWKPGNEIRINRRLSYPQLTFDGPFIDYLRSQEGLENITHVPIGGAGIAAMQVFRNYVEPTEHLPGFSDLEPLTILFNAQPDWKTWDTDPTDVIADALGLPLRTDIYGESLQANAANTALEEMHHTTGYVLSTSPILRGKLTEGARNFRDRNPDCPLTKKDYGYGKPIAALFKNKKL